MKLRAPFYETERVPRLPIATVAISCPLLNMTPNEIPPFTVSGILPPFMADPTNPATMSRYRTTLVKLVERYGTSPRRLQILWGLLAYRQELVSAGLSNGFQWLDGGFLEDVERTEKRPPGDVDLVNFVRRPAKLKSDHAAWGRFVDSTARLFDPAQTKLAFSCGAYFVDLDLETEHVVNHTRYWFGLFSHKRRTFVWKGLLEIPFGDPTDEAAASAIVHAKSAQP